MIKRADIYSLTKGTAAADDIANNKTASVNGAKITGLRKHIAVGASTYIYTIDSFGLNRLGFYYNNGYGVKDMVAEGTRIYIAQGYYRLYSNLKYLMVADLQTNSLNNSSFFKIVSDGTNLYAAGDWGVEKVSISGFSGGSASATRSYGGAVYGIDKLGTDVYFGGATVKKVFKAAMSNLAKTTESADYGGIIYSVCCDTTNIFAGGATTQKVYKYDTDLAKLAESADYGGTIRVIHQDGDYLYVGGETTKKVFKLLKSDLSKVTESADYGGTINAIKSDDTYLYIGGATTNKVFKLLKSDLSKIEESLTVGNTIDSICFL
jgi:hypothetical protein